MRKKYVKKFISIIKTHKYLSLAIRAFFMQTFSTLIYFFWQGKNTWSKEYLVNSILFSLILYILIPIFFYFNEIRNWANIKTKKINYRKYVFQFTLAILIISPAIMFLVGIQAAKLYFLPPLESSIGYIIYCIGLVALAVTAFVAICLQIKELYHYQTESESVNFKFFQLLFSLLLLIQTFAVLYIVVLSHNPNALSGMNVSSSVFLCFDATYFSTMTLLTGNCNIAPETVLAKTVTMLETFAFVIIISQIISGYFKKEN